MIFMLLEIQKAKNGKLFSTKFCLHTAGELPNKVPIDMLELISRLSLRRMESFQSASTRMHTLRP